VNVGLSATLSGSQTQRVYLAFPFQVIELRSEIDSCFQGRCFSNLVSALTTSTLCFRVADVSGVISSCTRCPEDFRLN
jgi:hypothetical protein